MPNLPPRIKQFLRPIATLKFVWESAPRWTIANSVLTITQGFLPLISLYLMKLFIDEVTAGVTTEVDLSTAFDGVLIVILLMGGTALASALIGLLSTWVSANQSMLVTDYMQDIIHHQSITVDMAFYENADFYNKLQRAQREAPMRPMQILNNLTSLGRNGVALTGLGGLLLIFHWSIAIILLLIVLPSFLIRLHYSRVTYNWQRQRTEDQRLVNYLNWLLLGGGHAKEIRLFDLGGILRERFQILRRVLRTEQINLQMRQSIMSFAAQTFTTLLIYGSYALVAYQTLEGTETLGSLVLYYQMLQRGQSYLSNFLGSIAGLNESRLFVTDLYEFLSLKPQIVSPPNPTPVPQPITHQIEFRDVSFDYPLSTRHALRHINLTIAPGEKIALVGENGSGKTTLIKLLCRLYDPDEGAILADDIRLPEFDVLDWRRNVGVILQDYAQYNLSARENIWFGNIALDPQADAIEIAARDAGANTVIERLPQRYDTVLGKLFADGEQLSVGEWQKVGLARALVRDAQIIVLDEPTSAMDARSEYQIYELIRNSTEGKTVILISHRFSTVRMVDRIFVLEEGQIIEHGSHDELLKLDGKYAQMFKLQAQNYL